MFSFLLAVAVIVLLLCKEKRDSDKPVYDSKGYEIKKAETLAEMHERLEKWYEK